LFLNKYTDSNKQPLSNKHSIIQAVISEKSVPDEADYSAEEESESKTSLSSIEENEEAKKEQSNTPLSIEEWLKCPERHSLVVKDVRSEGTHGFTEKTE